MPKLKGNPLSNPGSNTHSDQKSSEAPGTLRKGFTHSRGQSDEKLLGHNSLPRRGVTQCSTSTLEKPPSSPRWLTRMAGEGHSATAAKPEARRSCRAHRALTMHAGVHPAATMQASDARSSTHFIMQERGALCLLRLAALSDLGKQKPHSPGLPTACASAPAAAVPLLDPTPPRWCRAWFMRLLSFGLADPPLLIPRHGLIRAVAVL